MMTEIRIKHVEFLGLRTALEPPARFSWGLAHERNVGLVRVTLTDDSVGWGESSVTFPLWTLEERAATVNVGIGPLAIGKLAGTLEEIRESISELNEATFRLRDLWSPVAISSAIAALEMSLLDALGVRLEEPVWRIFGGESRATQLYAVGFTGTPHEAVQQASIAIESGYKTVKIRLGFGMEKDVELMSVFRDELGADVEILADVNMGWNVETTLEMLPIVESFGIGWLEEPLPRMDLEGLKKIQKSTDIPIAAGENCYSLDEAAKLMDSGAINIYMPDLARGGGFIAGLNAKNQATSLGLAYSPHHYASDIGFAAMVSFCCVGAPALTVLRDLSNWPLRETILEQPLEIVGGEVKPSDEPGMGPRPNIKVIEASRVL